MTALRCEQLLGVGAGDVPVLRYRLQSGKLASACSLYESLQCLNRVSRGVFAWNRSPPNTGFATSGGLLRALSCLLHPMRASYQGKHLDESLKPICLVQRYVWEIDLIIVRLCPLQVVVRRDHEVYNDYLRNLLSCGSRRGRRTIISARAAGQRNLRCGSSLAADDVGRLSWWAR
jgi:hypothetical protein